MKEDRMREPLTVTVQTASDGTETLTVEQWPSETAFADGIWDQCDPAFLRREGDAVIIEVSNGRATYQQDGERPGARVCSIAEAQTETDQPVLGGGQLLCGGV